MDGQEHGSRALKLVNQSLLLTASWLAVKQHSQPLLPSQSLSPSSRASPPPPPLAEDNPLSPVSRQPSLDPLCGLESVPLLYTSSGMS